jgi:DNA-binding NtrC family response regulator
MRPVDKVLLYEEDADFRSRIVSELSKYEGQFGLVVTSTLAQARKLISAQSIVLCVAGIDMATAAHVDLISWSSTQHLKVPFILMQKESAIHVSEVVNLFNILKVFTTPFELSEISNAVIEGLDAIDEGLLYRRLRSV